MHLPPLVEQQLDKEIEELYMNLQPREIDTQKRRDFVIKIQTLVGIEWPDRDIQVHAFGSSVNGLGSADSDVDLCFTTSWKDTQRG
ncbi:hypothetical protein HDU99_007677, partial [Rhizoclosmatium hyalinum]